MKLTLPAPAKLNLMLHITGRRPDGYHELQTLFQFLDFADQLTFASTPASSVQLQTDRPELRGPDNLILKAAELLRRHTGTAQGAEITLDKRLPMGGGIGGGSSDAATTLLALNRLWDLDLPLEQLAELGLQLGADVPVFVHGRAAFAEGVGEKLTPVNPPEPWYLVLVPQVQISTREIFCDPALTRDSSPIKVRTVLEQSSRNDCQAVVMQRYPEVREALEELNRFTPARLTGTGCCVFGGFPEQAEADKVAAQLPSHLQGFIARGSNRSMLHRALESEENESLS